MFDLAFGTGTEERSGGSDIRDAHTGVSKIMQKIPAFHGSPLEGKGDDVNLSVQFIIFFGNGSIEIG